MNSNPHEEHATPLLDWPQPNGGAPEPEVMANDRSLIIRYLTEAERIAVAYFPLCSVFKFGAPNDEALFGHPLYGKGLKFYSVHRVENSSWLASLERQNSVHHLHDPKLFLDGKEHYIFTFHDSTLECVVNEGKFWKPEITQFDDEKEVAEFIRRKRQS